MFRIPPNEMKSSKYIYEFYDLSWCYEIHCLISVLNKDIWRSQYKRKERPKSLLFVSLKTNPSGSVSMEISKRPTILKWKVTIFKV